LFCDVECTGGYGQKVRKMMDEIEKANLKELSQHYKASHNEIVMLNKEDIKHKKVEYALEDVEQERGAFMDFINDAVISTVMTP
jgi:hypothetical protein